MYVGFEFVKYFVNIPHKIFDNLGSMGWLAFQNHYNDSGKLFNKQTEIFMIKGDSRSLGWKCSEK